MIKTLRYITVIFSILLVLSLINGCCCCCSDIFDQDDFSNPDSNSNSYSSEDYSVENTGTDYTTTSDEPGDNTITMKAIIVLCDDYIDPSNNGIATGVRENYRSVTKLLDRIEKRGIMPVERVVLKGKEATTENIKRELKRNSADSDDVLFFYYSGHGGMTGGQTFLWPCDEKDIFRSEIQELVNSRPARFKLIITDACSSSIDSVGYKNIQNYMGSVANVEVYDEYYRSLFLGYEGLLDYTAATEGEYAWYNYLGGFFTISLVEEILLQNPSMKWEDVIKASREKTEEKFKEMYNMGFVTQEDIQDMEDKNITNQSPQVYAYPSPIEDGGVVYTEPTPFDTEPVYEPQDVQVIIENGTSAYVTFYIDDNTDMDNWDESNCQESGLSPGEKITLKNPQEIRVFYDKGNGQIDYYALETGNYYFDYDSNSLIDLYIGSSSETSTSSSILIYNFNYFDVDFTLEYSSGVTEEYSLKPNEYAMPETDDELQIYFGEISYLLDPGGSYYFSTNERNQVDIYIYE